VSDMGLVDTAWIKTREVGYCAEYSSWECRSYATVFHRRLPDWLEQISFDFKVCFRDDLCGTVKGAMVLTLFKSMTVSSCNRG